MIKSKVEPGALAFWSGTIYRNLDSWGSRILPAIPISVARLTRSEPQLSLYELFQHC